MEDLFSKCGARCSHCPAYRENVRSDDDRQRCSDGWHKYLGPRVTADRCYCDGCQTPDDENPILVYGRGGCNIRRCAVKNGVETCAQCAVYPCEPVRTQFSFDSESREQIAARLGTPVPDADYASFIEPYELHRHLNEIRVSLGPQDIVEPAKPPPFKPKTADFPARLPYPAQETSAFKALHRLIGTLNTINANTFIMQHRLKKRRQDLLRLLWTFGLAGELQEEGGGRLTLVLDGDIYYQHKLPGQHTRVLSLHRALEEHGVHCEIVPLGEEWLMPSGWMRQRGRNWDKGWLMKMAFDDEAGGDIALRALKTYTAKLEKKYGKAAYRRFSTADMGVLSEG
jgi:hypothetical protein